MEKPEIARIERIERETPAQIRNEFNPQSLGSSEQDIIKDLDAVLDMLTFQSDLYYLKLDKNTGIVTVRKRKKLSIESPDDTVVYYTKDPQDIEALQDGLVK